MKGTFEKQEHFQLRGLRLTGFHGYPPMFHTHAELLYVIKGSICTTVDGKMHRLQEGELLLLFPYLTHSYESAADAEVIVILFDPASISFDNTLLTKKPVCHFTDGRAFFPMLDRAVTLVKLGKIKTALGYLNAVLGELLEILPLEDAEDISGDTAVKILEYCTEHFAENISLKTVARALYVSPSYVSKIFSDKLRYSFREYINSLRIEKAKSLLQETDLPITDVMFHCGFKNQSSFNRVFRDFCGCTPSAYKKTLFDPLL